MELLKTCKYESKKPDSQGYINYTDEENETWSILYERQWKLIQNRACDEYIQGVSDLQLDNKKIPQIPTVNEKLMSSTGWKITPVAALIDFDKFYTLLANREFPCATFIRTREELDYLQEPDLFHEIFGHCPLLTNPYYADFMHEYGKMALNANAKDRIMLARLYWFTIEFGLLKTPKGLKIYGGGILSSKSETLYSLESDVPKRVSLDLLDCFRTPYRIDILQTKYFVIEDLKDLFKLSNENLLSYITQARTLGMHEPTYPKRVS